MCESYNEQYKTNFKCLMPTNTFGPKDKYNLLNSHFFPALINKILFYCGEMVKQKEKLFM